MGTIPPKDTLRRPEIGRVKPIDADFAGIPTPDGLTDPTILPRILAALACVLTALGLTVALLLKLAR